MNNMSAVIAAVIFLVISVALLTYFLIGKGPLAGSKYKNFYRACCGVYVSGNLLVFVFTLIMKGLPVAFVIISDVTILFVFIFTAGLIYFMTKSIVEAAEKAKAAADSKTGQDNDDGKN